MKLVTTLTALLKKRGKVTVVHEAMEVQTNLKQAVENACENALKQMVKKTDISITSTVSIEFFDRIGSKMKAAIDLKNKAMNHKMPIWINLLKQRRWSTIVL